MRASKSQYKVTVSVYVHGNNARHAAHIAKGVLQSKDAHVERFIVEEQPIIQVLPRFAVDLSKEAGEEGYQEVI